MDIREIRRLNLLHLSAGYGTKTEFADALGISKSFLSQILSEKNPRGVANQLARKLEAALGLDVNSLDTLMNQESTDIDYGAIASVIKSADSIIEELGIDPPIKDREAIYHELLKLTQQSKKK